MESEGNYKIHLGISIKRENELGFGIELQIKNLRDNLDGVGGWSDCLQLQRVDIPLICLISPGHAWSKQDKTKQNAGETLHCIVVLVSIMSHPQRRRKRHHHIATDLKYGEDCTVMFLGTALSALVWLFGLENKLGYKLLESAQCHLDVRVPNSWLVDVRAVSALWWLRGRLGN